MKYLLITIAAVMLVWCGNPEADKALRFAATEGNIEAAKQAIDDGADVNAKNNGGNTPLDQAIRRKHSEIAALLRKHGGKTGEDLKAEGNLNQLPPSLERLRVVVPDCSENLGRNEVLQFHYLSTHFLSLYGHLQKMEKTDELDREVESLPNRHFPLPSDTQAITKKRLHKFSPAPPTIS